MNVLEAIYARRAVRSFLPKPVPEETIRTLLRAAVQAPTAMHAEPWVFAVVQDAATLKRWSDRAKAMMLDRTHAAYLADLLRSESFDIFYDAGTLIVIGANARAPYVEADCWLAAENLMLAACDAGLGTCPIGFALPLLDTEEVKRELHLPPNGVAVAALILGYPREQPAPVPRKEPQVSAWIR
jgi:nitroreductase